MIAQHLIALLLLAQAGEKPFAIEVVDDRTGRGVPLVELRTVNDVRLVTDSNGLAAFAEPGLMDQSVYFHVASHGYEYPKDGFGYRGKALDVRPGGSARLEIKRINIAERLYRVTGGGIYRDTVLLGREPPTRHPVLDAQVLGQDSVLNALYRGKLRWFWGDTNRPGYPLGNFHSPGAVSLLPADGGLAPEVGVDLEYFTDAKGFARPTAEMPGAGPTWLSGLVALKDRDGRERMFATYVKIRNALETYERGLVEYDDEKDAFRKVATFPLDAPAFPDGHPLRVERDGTDYFYYANSIPLTRIRADVDLLKDPANYEAFTCLVAGSRLDDPKVDRDDRGAVRYGWKRDTPAVGASAQAKLVKGGQLKPEEALIQLREADTGKAVSPHNGSVYWNDYRRRWVLIVCETFGTSMLGETWFAEADTPLGPWVYARKVVTHDRYSFYNPKQHPHLAQDGGRTIYFEGTYTITFSGNTHPTPRYDYNQIMYRLDLSDPRLNLPVPVYRLSEKGDDLGAAHPGHPVAFFALDRPGSKTLPVYGSNEGGGHVLKVGDPPSEDAKPLFHALPADADDPPATTVPLFEFVGDDGSRAYGVEADRPGFKRSDKPFCRVWANPLGVVLPPS